MGWIKLMQLYIIRGLKGLYVLLRNEIKQMRKRNERLL